MGFVNHFLRVLLLNSAGTWSHLRPFRTSRRDDGSSCSRPPFGKRGTSGASWCECGDESDFGNRVRLRRTAVLVAQVLERLERVLEWLDSLLERPETESVRLQALFLLGRLLGTLLDTTSEAPRNGESLR